MTMMMFFYLMGKILFMVSFLVEQYLLKTSFLKMLGLCVYVRTHYFEDIISFDLLVILLR